MSHFRKIPTKADKGKLDAVNVAVTASRSEDARTCKYKIDNVFEYNVFGYIALKSFLFTIIVTFHF